jgi:hypothetical protein
MIGRSAVARYGYPTCITTTPVSVCGVRPTPRSRGTHHLRAKLLRRYRGKLANGITDNGPECTGLALECWANEHAVHHRFITLGKASQNGSIQSSNGRRREECLSRTPVPNLDQARELISADLDNKNLNPPHSALDGPAPSEFTAQIARIPMEAPRTQTPLYLDPNPRG